MAVRRRGKIWFIDYYVDGKRYRETIGTNRKMAERALAKRLVQIAEGRFLEVKQKAETLFATLAGEYLQYADTNKLSAERDHRSIAVLSRWFGDKRLADITPHAIEQFKTDRRREVGPASVNKELACLKHMFSKAIAWDLADANPVKKVRLFREPPGRVRFLTHEEIGRLYAEAAPHLQPILTVALYTGMRKSEILRLEWTDVDLNNRIIYVRDSKNGTAREIPMADEVIAALSALPATGTQVFTRPDGGTVTSMQTAFYNAIRRAQLEDFSFHDLRHTFASHLVMSGVDLLTVKEILGHKTIAMTLRYAHLSPSHRRKAIESLHLLDGHKSGTGEKKPVAPKRVKRYPASIAGVVEVVDTRDLKSLGV